MCVLGMQRTLCTWTVRTGGRSMCLMSLGEFTTGLKHRLASGRGTMARYSGQGHMHSGELEAGGLGWGGRGDAG